MAITHVEVKDGRAVTVPMRGGASKTFQPGAVIDLEDTADHFRESLQEMNEREERMFAVHTENGKKVKRPKPKEEAPPATAEEAHARAKENAKRLAAQKKAVPVEGDDQPKPPAEPEAESEGVSEKEAAEQGPETESKGVETPEAGVSEG